YLAEFTRTGAAGFRRPSHGQGQANGNEQRQEPKMGRTRTHQEVTTGTRTPTVLGTRIQVKQVNDWRNGFRNFGRILSRITQGRRRKLRTPTKFQAPESKSHAADRNAQMHDSEAASRKPTAF